jgi:hypothetical protein
MFPFSFLGSGIDAQAQAHYNRVIADGGLIPSGLSGVNAFFTTIKTIYATADITTAISVGLDAQVLGYKLGAGAGTTAGQAAQKLYSCSGASGDVVQTTAASQPLLLAHSGSNYLFSPRVDGNFCSTPSAAANSISGNIDIRVYYQSNTSGIVQTLLMKGDTSAYNYAFDISDTNNLRFIYGGFNIVSSSVTVNPLTLQYYRVTRDSLNGNVIFYTSLDGITFTQLGTTQTTAAGILPVNLNDISIGDNTAFAGNGAQGNIFRLTVANSIGGAPVVDFNPNQYNAATSQTNWTSSTGEIWSVQTGTATSGYKGVLVDRTIVQSDGIDDGLLTSATINMPTVLTIYGAIKGYNNEEGSGKSLFGKSNIDGNVYRKSATELGAWIGNAGLAYYGVLANVTNLNLVTFKRKVSDNVLQANNGSIVNNTNSSAIVNSTISMFSVTTFGSSNGIVNTGVISFIEDNSTQRTAMYNYIRSINNLAF